MPNPLRSAVDEYLAAKGKTANYAPRAELGGTIRLQDDCDGRGPFIAWWDESLGQWPTQADGFSADQLRRRPAA